MGWMAAEALVDAGMIGAAAVGTGVGMANAMGADLTAPFKGNTAPAQQPGLANRPAVLNPYASRP
jgi:hypothetical protein